LRKNAHLAPTQERYLIIDKFLYLISVPRADCSGENINFFLHQLDLSINSAPRPYPVGDHSEGNAHLVCTQDDKPDLSMKFPYFAQFSLKELLRRFQISSASGSDEPGFHLIRHHVWV
jgi:hypothetical protein